MKPIPQILVLAATILIGGCRADDARAEFTATPVPLRSEQPERDMLGSLRFLGGLRLAGEGVGGLSGMLAEDGEIVAVSDAADWLRLRPRHDADGRLVGADFVARGTLADETGRPIQRKSAGDAESMARLEEGILVAFEQQHRLWLYPPDLSGPPRRLDAPAGVRRLPSNGGMEAVAELGAGRLLILAEDGDDTHAQGWIGSPGRWQSFQYLRTGEFKPTGAAPLPSGEVLVVERRFSLLGGLAVRLVVVDPRRIEAGAVVEPRELAQLAPPLTLDNFEAVAVVRRGGETVAYLLSDDNFSPLQSTLLFAFAIP